MGKMNNPAILMLGLLLAAGAAGCGNEATAPAGPPAGNVAVESAGRAVATVGAPGGAVATTDTRGVSYVLDVPAGALPGDVEIALTPVTAIRDLPFPGEMLAAVRLEPSGLTLLKPAVLTIGTAASLADSQVLTGFSYEGDATSVELTGAFAVGGAIQVLVSHFSGAGAAGIDRDWMDLDCGQPFLDMPFSMQLALCISPIPEEGARFLQFAADYLDQIVTPALNGALDLSLAEAVALYMEWYWSSDLFAGLVQALDWETTLADRIVAADDLVEQKLREAIALEKAALCATGGGFENLRAVFEYQKLAVAVGLHEEPGFTDQDVLAGLCAEVVMEELTLADPLPVGSDHSLDARAALLIHGERVDAGFEFLVNGTENLACGANPQPCGGRSNGLGEFTTVLRRTSQEPTAINILAYLLLPLFVAEEGGGFALTKTPLECYRLLLRGGGTVEATFPAFVVPAEPVALAVRVLEADVVGTARPVPFAVLTFTADGAVVEPAQTIADQDGRAEVTVTAQEGARTVTVDITAALDGVDIAIVQVVATVGDVTILLTRHAATSRVVAGTYNPASNCSLEDLRRDRLNQGRVDTLTAVIQQDCSTPVATGSVFASSIHNSDPGIAADLRSATLVVSNSGTGIITVEPDNVAFLQFVIESYGGMTFTIQGGPVAFAIEGEVELTYIGASDLISSSISLSGSGGTVFEFNRTVGDGGPDRMVASGILAPGTYGVACFAGGASDVTIGSANHSLSIFNRLTLRLGSAATNATSAP